MLPGRAIRHRRHELYPADCPSPEQAETVRSQRPFGECRQAHKIQLYDAAWPTEANRSIDQLLYSYSGRVDSRRQNLRLLPFDELVSVRRTLLRPADVSAETLKKRDAATLDST